MADTSTTPPATQGADGSGAQKPDPKNKQTMTYPWGKFNFMVTVSTPVEGTSTTQDYSKAAFSEISGLDSTVEVIEFRQGNAHSLSPMKLPGLVRHGNVTLKMGYTVGSSFKNWIKDCVSHTRGNVGRSTVTIELFDSNLAMPEKEREGTNDKDSNGACWILNDAWVCKYNGPDLNSTASEVAIESVEIAYETLTIPN